MKTLYVLYPLSREAKEWVDEHVHYENYQMVGNGIGVEHRYIDPIVGAMLEEGLKYSEDFTVY
jgi:hypothetical protein